MTYRDVRRRFVTKEIDLCISYVDTIKDSILVCICVSISDIKYE